MQSIGLGFALLSGFFDAGFRTVIKVTNIHRFILAAGGHIFALPIYVVLIAIVGIPEIRPLFWWGVAVHIPFYVMINILIIEAHRDSSPMIVTMPYLALTPVFQLFLAPIQYLITETGWPTIFGFIGVVIVVLGVYFLNTRDKELTFGRPMSFLDPFKRIKAERAPRLMFFVAVLAGCAGIPEYIAIANTQSLNPLGRASFYLLIDHGITGVIFIGLAFLYTWLDRIKKSDLKIDKRQWGILLLFSLLSAATALGTALSYQWLPEVAYIFAAKRSGAIFFGVGIGLVLALLKCFGGKHKGELQHLKWRISGMAVIIAGMLLILLLGRSA